MKSTTTWLLELSYDGKAMPKYLSKHEGLTNDAWFAKRFKTEAQAQMYKDRFLTKSLPNIKPVDHIFIPD